MKKSLFFLFNFIFLILPIKYRWDSYFLPDRLPSCSGTPNSVESDGRINASIDLPGPQEILLESFLVTPYWNTSPFGLLPNLSQFQWPTPEYAPKPVGMITEEGVVIRRPAPFEPTYSRAQQALARRLLQTFAQILSNNGLGDRFFLTGGTLHGSLRHHDFIPWDDDTDVLLDYCVLPQVMELLRQLEPDYIFSYGIQRSKFFTKRIPDELQFKDVEYSRNTLNDASQLWPSLDIGYYAWHGDHVWEVASWGVRRFFWHKADIFPLLFRPLKTHWYPTPFNPIRFIRSNVPQTKYCIRSGMDHVFEILGWSAWIPCEQLADRYAFVARSPSPTHKLKYPIRWQPGFSQLVVANERLERRKPGGTATEVFHTLRLPSHVEVASLDTYNYG